MLQVVGSHPIGSNPDAAVGFDDLYDYLGEGKCGSECLRPVVSIDLKFSGYSLVPKEDGMGKINGFELKK